MQQKTENTDWELMQKDWVLMKGDWVLMQKHTEVFIDLLRK